MTGRTSTSQMRVASVVLAALLVSACASGTAYRAPGFPFGPSYRGWAGVPVLLQNASWWKRFEDPVLDRLVTLTLAQSPTLAEARARARAAEASLRAVPGAFALRSSVQAGLEGSDAANVTESGTATVGLSWLLDPYGSRAANLRIAASERDIAAAEADAAQLVALLNVSSAYLSLRHAQVALALGRAEEERQRATLALTRQLANSEQVSELDVLRAQARLATVQADLPGLEATIPARLGELAVLAGQAPGTLPPDLMAQLQHKDAQPQAGLSGDIGVPADLLRNRPDIRIAERSYYSAVARIATARAALYPRLSLTGSISRDMVAGRTEYVFGPTLNLPDLPIGSPRAGVDAAEAQAAAAHAAWKARVLAAILEVEIALGDYHSADSALTAAAEAARLNRRALGMMRKLFEAGEATLTDLISAEEATADAERKLADLRLAHGQSFVQLNVKLGAGQAAEQ